MHAPPDLIVRGLALDSRKVEEGFLFFALPGEKEDGGEFIAEAKARGAACAVCEHPPETEIPYILVPDAHKALALCAAVWYGTPAGKLTVVGVTGTNGKTTTTYLIKQLLERTKGAKVGLIGTNQNLISDKTIPTDRTTPDALTVQRLLAQMVDAGCTYAVMEVSSHALMQSRVEGIRFRVGVFTNLTQDHLDYHGTMEAYCDAKSRLFDQCDIACVNGDDAWTERLLARFTSERITFGQGMTNDLVGWRARYENDCVRFTACTDFDHEETKIGIPGGFSLYNALASLSAVQALGVPLSDAAKALTECVGVKGRCEVVPLDAPFTVIIDYAHTPDGLKNILSTVCGFADGASSRSLAAGETATGQSDPAWAASLRRSRTSLSSRATIPAPKTLTPSCEMCSPPFWRAERRSPSSRTGARPSVLRSMRRKRATSSSSAARGTRPIRRSER